MALFRLSPAGFERDLAVSLIGHSGNLLQVVKLIVAPNAKWSMVVGRKGATPGTATKKTFN